MITKESKTSEIFQALENQINTGKLVVYAITPTKEKTQSIMWVIKRQNDVPSNGNEDSNKSFAAQNYFLKTLGLDAEIAPTRNLYRAMMPMSNNIIEAQGWKAGSVIDDFVLCVEHSTKPYFKPEDNNGNAQKPEQNKEGIIRTFKGEKVYKKVYPEHISDFKGHRTFVLDKVGAVKVDLRAAMLESAHLNTGIADFNQ